MVLIFVGLDWFVGVIGVGWLCCFSLLCYGCVGLGVFGFGFILWLGFCFWVVLCCGSCLSVKCYYYVVGCVFVYFDCWVGGMFVVTFCGFVTGFVCIGCWVVFCCFGFGLLLVLWVDFGCFVLCWFGVLVGLIW